MPIERYIRCSVTRGSWTVEPGLEWRDGDNFDALCGDLRVIAAAVADLAGVNDAIGAAQRAESVFRRWWPGRAFFVEVHDVEGRWTQTFQPFGMPRQPEPRTH